MNPKHSIEVEISPTGEITATVKGVTGTACTQISAWLDKMGEVVEDKHTIDFSAPPQKAQTVGKVS